jgi:hypothetical protein
MTIRARATTALQITRCPRTVVAGAKPTALK